MINNIDRNMIEKKQKILGPTVKLTEESDDEYEPSESNTILDEKTRNNLLKNYLIMNKNAKIKDSENASNEALNEILYAPVPYQRAYWKEKKK